MAQRLSGSPRVTTKTDVIVRHVGKSYLFIFPAPRGRFTGLNGNPAGEILIGETITVAYALKIVQGGKPRFVSIDGDKLKNGIIERLRIALTAKPSGRFFGFLVSDTQQPDLSISISPSFMKNASNKVGLYEQIARSGNLSITLAPARMGVKVSKVVLN